MAFERSKSRRVEKSEGSEGSEKSEKSEGSEKSKGRKPATYNPQRSTESYDFLVSLSRRLPNKMEKTFQGTSDAMLKIKPMVPKVDGIRIKKPDIKPHIAVALEKVRSFSMIRDRSKRVAPE